MPGLGSAARPLAGVAHRARPVSHTTTAGPRAFGMKQQRGVAPAPAPRRATERESSSTRRGRPEAFSVSKSTRAIDVKREDSVARLAAPVHDTAAGERAFRKRRLDAPRETSHARRPGVEFSDPNPKRVKVTCAAAVDMPVNTRPQSLKKRLASELDALRELVKKVETLSRGNGRFLAAKPRQEETPAAKRMKTSSPIVERIDARHMMSLEEGEIVVVSPVVVSLDKADESKINIVPAAEQDEYVDICGGGVDATPIVPLEVASEACSPTRSSSDSGSSASSDSDSDDDSASSSSSGSDDSSSDSDSDSESGSDSDETAESPAPAAVPPKVNNTPSSPVQNVTSSAPPPPSPEPTSETVQRTVQENDSDESVSSPDPPPVLPNKMDSPAPAPAEPQPPEKKVESNVPISVLLARAKEANEIRMQKGSGWEREKTRRAVREMEKAVLPDESIHPWDLTKVGIREFEYVLEDLGISLRTDV